MTKVLTKNITNEFTKSMKKTLSNASIRAIALSLLFIISGIGASVLINPVSAAANPAAPSTAAPAPVAAATPLTQAEASWSSPNGNAFGQDYNPQNVINSSNAQYLGIHWLFPLPTLPTAFTSFGGFAEVGVDTAVVLINGTVYAVTQFDQVFALNAANGDVEWNDQLPILANSTAGKNSGPISFHFHDGDIQFTTTLFNHTPTIWVSASDLRDYAINALSGKYELNFSVFDGVSTVAGDNPNSIEGSFQTNVLVDQNHGILISSEQSGSSAGTGRCFYRGWNILVNPPQLLWTTFCTPPQPGGNLPVDPNWDISQVNNMTGAEIFNPGPQYNNGGPIPGTAVVNLKSLSQSQLNATLYNDWGYANQTPACLAADAGSSTGSTAAGWGGSWILGTGPTADYAFVNTNNPDPYNSICTPGTLLWSASALALNVTNGHWIWGFQTSSHDTWDLDCSWWQALGNETINGVNTQVEFKLCKNGYLYELNAVNGNMIWAYTPPASSIPHCSVCFIHNPFNETQMTLPFMNPSLNATVFYPGAAIGEMEASFNPALNYVFFADEDIPNIAIYVPFNSTNYYTNPGMAMVLVGPIGANNPYTSSADNATVTAVNAATGQAVWSHFIPTQGYRGGIMSSGGLVFLTLSSGDMDILNARTGDLVNDLFIGGPLNVLPSIGATVTGQEEVIFPITAGIVSWGAAVPGDIVALTLQAQPGGTVSTTTVTAQGPTTTTTTTATITGSGGVTTTTTTTTTVSSSGSNSTTLYAVAAVAVIFIVVSGYLAMTRGRKPAS
jgi:outer membrane protein assembly factor BamB